MNTQETKNSNKNYQKWVLILSIICLIGAVTGILLMKWSLIYLIPPLLCFGLVNYWVSKTTNS